MRAVNRARSRVELRRGCAVVAAVLTLLASGVASAQECRRMCRRGERRDVHGCCVADPAAQPPPPRPRARPRAGAAAREEAPCAEGDHLSDGHCCGPGEDWLPARRRCVCLEPSVCASGAAAVAGTSSAQGGPESLPEAPSRDDVRRAMRSGAADVRACGAGTGGTAMVMTVFDNTGRVISVGVTGVASAREIACIERVVRRITVPHFRRATFSVVYPYPVE